MAVIRRPGRRRKQTTQTQQTFSPGRYPHTGRGFFLPGGALFLPNECLTRYLVERHLGWGDRWRSQKREAAHEQGFQLR